MSLSQYPVHIFLWLLFLPLPLARSLVLKWFLHVAYFLFPALTYIRKHLPISTTLASKPSFFLKSSFNSLFGEISHQIITACLNQLYHDNQYHHGNQHHFRVKTFITISNRQITQATPTDSTSHR